MALLDKLLNPLGLILLIGKTENTGKFRNVMRITNHITEGLVALG